MKLFSSFLAAATVACAAYALLDPARAQQSTTPPPEKQENGEVKGTTDTHQRRWVPGNFRLTIEGKEEGFVESVEQKQNVTTDNLGDARGYETEPIVPPPQTVVTQPPQDAAPQQPQINQTAFLPSGVRVRPPPNLTVREAQPAETKEDDDNDDD